MVPNRSATPTLGPSALLRTVPTTATIESAWFDRAMRAEGVPILTYHSIDNSGSVISVAPDLFRAQMADLAEHEFQTLTLSEAVAHLASGTPIPERSVVLTFDDGYKNVYTEAFAVMAQYGFRATVFLITDRCGSPDAHPPPGGINVRLHFMDWSEVREMHASGMEMGAHTRTHPDLTHLSFDDAREEIVTSKDVLRDALSSEVKTFAYPFGYYDERVRAIVREHFLGAVSTRLGIARRGGDPHALLRIDMYYLQPFRLSTALLSTL